MIPKSEHRLRSRSCAGETTVSEAFVTLDERQSRLCRIAAGPALAVEGLSIIDQPRRIRRGRRALRLRQVDIDETRDRACSFRSPDTCAVADQKVTAAGQDRRHGLPGADPVALAHDAGKSAAAAGNRPAAPQRDAPAQGAIYRPGAPEICRPRWALRGLGSKFPWELSGGMQQRTSLCRALIHEPQLLMLDEPFGALDAFTREELWCVIRDLQAARKITVILVTHDLREAVFLADRVFVMSSAARTHRCRTQDRIAAATRSGRHLHARNFRISSHELRGHIVKARQ